MDKSKGFPPIAREDARVLVLGSLPGQRSLTESRYYAHPQNAFWPIMQDVFGINGSYVERCAALEEHRIALWDVLRASVRPGSLDSDIRLETATANDFATFLSEYSCVQEVMFNGKKAEQMFRRMVPQALCQNLRLTALPSTSPAYAAMPYEAKLEIWKNALMPALAGNDRHCK
jgi:TDG/mug DNA glycosylase family protein